MINARARLPLQLLLPTALVSVCIAISGCGPRPIASGSIIKVVHQKKNGNDTHTTKWGAGSGSVEVFQDVVVVTNDKGNKFVAPRSEFEILELK
jgi:hypothetical protein